jgi:hypothetical protein
MQYQKRNYIKTYDENGILVSKVKVGSPVELPVEQPVEEILDVEPNEELGNE